MTLRHILDADMSPLIHFVKLGLIGYGVFIVITVVASLALGFYMWRQTK